VDKGIDKNRRKFLKIILIGGGIFAVGKILGPLFSPTLNSSLTKETEKVINKPTSFKISEKNKTLTIYDKTGEEVFQIDNN
jgi:hypothetical protein